MFQSLRQNSQIYVFHKGDKPFIETGYVTSVSMPKPRYGLPPTFGQQQEMVVDIVAKINGVVTNYNLLPATLDIADTFSGSENIVISDSREAMNAEILAFKQKSIDAIKNIDSHKNIIATCEQILTDLNPEYAEKQLQQTEINSLKTQMQDMSATLSSLTDLIKELKESKHE